MDFTGKAMKGFVFVSADGLKTERMLQSWVDRGVAFASSLPPKKYDLSVQDDVESLVVYGADGRDLLTARGGAGTGFALQRGVGLVGMKGSDRLLGGPGFDVLDDQTGTGDRDALRAGGGNDNLFTRDGDGLDRAIGGKGNDNCSVNRRDVKKSC